MVLRVKAKDKQTKKNVEGYLNVTERGYMIGESEIEGETIKYEVRGVRDRDNKLLYENDLIQLDEDIFEVYFDQLYLAYYVRLWDEEEDYGLSMELSKFLVDNGEFEIIDREDRAER